MYNKEQPLPTVLQMQPHVDLLGLMDLINKFNDPVKMAALEADGKLALDNTKKAIDAVKLAADNLSKALLDLQQILED